MENISELQAAVKVASNVSLAHSAVEEVRRIIAQLVRAARYVQAGDLHLALAIVNDLRDTTDLRAPHTAPPSSPHACAQSATTHLSFPLREHSSSAACRHSVFHCVEGACVATPCASSQPLALTATSRRHGLSWLSPAWL